MKNRIVVFLRGINVGGHKKFTKEAQLQMLRNLGYDHAQVYLHTGNWIITSTESTKALETTIAKAIESQFSWNVTVLAKKASDLAQILSQCPFSDEIRLKSYFVLLKEVPSKNAIATVSILSSSKEEFIITKECIYIYYTEGAGKAKMGNNFFERKLKVSATTRNYRTMAKLIAMSIHSNS